MDFYGHLAFCRDSAVSSSSSWISVLTRQGGGLHLVWAVCGDSPVLHQQHLPAGVHDHQGPRQVAQEHEPSLQGLPAGAAQQESPPASVLARPSLPPLCGLCSQRYQSLSNTFSHGCICWYESRGQFSACKIGFWCSTDCDAVPPVLEGVVESLW